MWPFLFLLRALTPKKLITLITLIETFELLPFKQSVLTKLQNLESNIEICLWLSDKM